MEAPQRHDIAYRLRQLSAQMDDLAVDINYFGGIARWAHYANEVSNVGIAFQDLADEIESAPDLRH